MKIFSEAENLPLPLLKIAKKGIFSQKNLINTYFKLQWDYFYIKRVWYKIRNKTSTNKLPESEFVVKKTWKMGYFHFCKFWLGYTYILILLITIDAIMNIVLDFCICILKQCLNTKFTILAPFQLLKKSKILPLPL